MKFSLFHLTSFIPEIHTTDAQFYQDILMETDRAEEYGFHSVIQRWVDMTGGEPVLLDPVIQVESG